MNFIFKVVVLAFLVLMISCKKDEGAGAPAAGGSSPNEKAPVPVDPSTGGNTDTPAVMQEKMKFDVSNTLALINDTYKDFNFGGKFKVMIDQIGDMQEDDGVDHYGQQLYATMNITEAKDGYFQLNFSSETFQNCQNLDSVVLFYIPGNENINLVPLINGRSESVSLAAGNYEVELIFTTTNKCRFMGILNFENN